VTPELDLTPYEINDPTLMQLWLAPFGTPLPTAWNGDVDPAFRFVGMVKRDTAAGLDLLAPVDLLAEPSRVRGPMRLTLTWPRMLRKHAAVMPLREYCSMVLAMPAPADRMLGVAPRVRLERFDVDVDGGASCTAVLGIADPDRTALHWYVGEPVFA
jgi:hypothetical protein